LSNPRGLYYKKLRPYFTDFRNKIECLSLVSLSSLVVGKATGLP